MLDFKTVLEAATKAFNENRLGAQNEMGECMYQYPGTNYVCAVGAAYTASDHNNKMSFDQIFPPPEGDSYDDYACICILQFLHDAWCTEPGQSAKFALTSCDHWPHDLDHWVYKWWNLHRSDPLDDNLFKSFLEWGARHVDL